MAFQTSVQPQQGAGLPGEMAFWGPLRATPAMLESANAANNVFGRWFTIAEVPTVSVEEGLRAQAGGTGAPLGLLANPKEHVSAVEGYDYTYALPNGVIAGFAKMGEYFVRLTNAAQPGNDVVYNTTTGVLSAIAAGGTPGAGTALVPNAKVIRYAGSITAPFDGLAVISLTN